MELIFFSSEDDEVIHSLFPVGILWNSAQKKLKKIEKIEIVHAMHNAHAILVAIMWLRSRADDWKTFDVIFQSFHFFFAS
jgi:hypothetical protein